MAIIFEGGVFDPPTGTTAERPTSGLSAGSIRYNTSLGVVEIYDGSNWFVSESYSYNTYPVKYVCVGGGGGGGHGASSRAAGGGGAGGMDEGTVFFNVGTQYTVTIGGGGGAATAINLYSGNGGNSSITGTGLVRTLIGRGGSRGSNVAEGAVGNFNTAAHSEGACGGGGGVAASDVVTHIFGMFPGTGSNQGSGGGCGGVYNTPTFNGGGGGGGTELPGFSFITGGGPVGGKSQGGSGKQNFITGTRYGGGGGGGYGTFGTGGGAGGSGGGGQGGDDTTGGSSGTSNTGGGGGGGGVSAGDQGGAGGSGIVIISMPTSRYSGTTTGSPSVSTSGNDTILTFTGSGTYTA